MEMEINHKGKKVSVCFDDQFSGLISSYKWFIWHGYARAHYLENGKRKSISMHRLVVNELSKSNVVHHINRNPLDNRLCNLQPVTQGRHFELHKTTRRNTGEKNSRHKLTQKDVLVIRQLSANGISGREIARRYSMGGTTIAYLLKGKTWTHI